MGVSPGRITVFTVPQQWRVRGELKRASHHHSMVACDPLPRYVLLADGSSHAYQSEQVCIRFLHQRQHDHAPQHRANARVLTLLALTLMCGTCPDSRYAADIGIARTSLLLQSRRIALYVEGLV
jgi:hypothetical protein